MLHNKTANILTIKETREREPQTVISSRVLCHLNVRKSEKHFKHCKNLLLDRKGDVLFQRGAANIIPEIFG